MSAAVLNLGAERRIRLGVALMRGDYATAFRLAIALAWEGDAQAQAIIGGLYALGHGHEEPDLVEGWAWLHMAVLAGNAPAKEMQTAAEKDMEPGQKAAAKARADAMLAQGLTRAWERMNERG